MTAEELAPVAHFGFADGTAFRGEGVRQRGSPQRTHRPRPRRSAWLIPPAGALRSWRRDSGTGCCRMAYRLLCSSFRAKRRQRSRRRLRQRVAHGSAHETGTAGDFYYLSRNDGPSRRDPARSLRQAPAMNSALAAFAESDHNLRMPSLRRLAMKSPKNRKRCSNDRRNIPQR